MIVRIVAGSGSVIAEQSRNRDTAIGLLAQKANPLFIRLVGHHVRALEVYVAVMAAQAQENAADFLTNPSAIVDRQNFRVVTTVTKRNRLAV